MKARRLGSATAAWRPLLLFLPLLFLPSPTTKAESCGEPSRRLDTIRDIHGQGRGGRFGARSDTSMENMFWVLTCDANVRIRLEVDRTVWAARARHGEAQWHRRGRVGTMLNAVCEEETATSSLTAALRPFMSKASAARASSLTSAASAALAFMYSS